MQRLDELESSAQRRQQGRERMLERIGWIVIAALLVLGCAGGLGPAAINLRNLQSAGGSLHARYQAIERCHAPAEIVLWVRATDTAKGPIVLSLSRELGDAVQLDEILPKPQRMIREEDRLRLVFAREDLLPPGQIRCQMRFDEWGILDSQIGVESGEAIRFRQFILP